MQTPTPFRETWNLAHQVGQAHNLEARIDSGRVYLGAHLMFDRLAPVEVNQARRDVLRGLVEPRGLCADCGAVAQGLDLDRGVEVCEQHRPKGGTQ